MGISPGALAGAGQAAGGVGGLIGGTNESSGSSFLSPTQAPFLSDLFSRAQDFSRQGTFVGFDPLQTQGQQSALSAIQGLGGLFGGAQGANQFLLGDVLNPASNPFLAATAQAATRPIFEGLTQNILPGIRGQAAQTGNVGSTRQGIAEGLASQGALRSAGDVSSNIFSTGYGQGLNALQQGLALAPQTAQFGLLPSQIQQQIGAQRRGLQQEQLLDPFTQLQRYQQLLGSPILESVQSSEGGTGLSGLLGGGGLGDLLGGGGLFSGSGGGGLLGTFGSGFSDLGDALGF